MSSLNTSSKNQTTQTNSTSEQNPWGPQSEQLERAFNRARKALDTAQGAPTPDAFVSQFTPDQLSIFQKMMNVGGSNLPGNAAGVSDALSGAGSSAVTGALSDLGAFNPKGGTQYNIDAASQYANNPHVDGMVDATMRDARRQVSEQALPQIARSAAGTGNVNSSRRALAEGVVERGLAEKTADVSNSLRGQLYNSGLDLAQREAQASNNDSLSAMMARLTGGNTAANTGVNAGANSVAQQKGLFDIASQGIAGQQAGSQAGLDEQMAKYMFGTNAPFDALNNFWNIVGSGNWGGTTHTQGTSNTQQTSTGSIFDGIGKGLGAIGTVGSWLKSDREAKTDIEVIGKLNDGLPIYRYRYKDDFSRHVYIGLMAQDVEQKYPEAVREIGGVKHVNYDLATFAAARQ